MFFSFVHNLILFSLLTFLAAHLLWFSFKYKKVNKYGFNSMILTAILLVIIALCILFIDWLLPYPLNGAINVWLGIILGIQGAYYLIIRFKYKERGNKANIEETAYNGGELKLQSELLRKSFHTVILLVVFCYFFIAIWANDVAYTIYLADPELYYSIWQTSNFPLNPATTTDLTIAFTWTFMFFICATLFLIIPDICRIYNRKYSIFSGVYKRVIRLKELYACGPQIYLTLACAFIFLLVVLGIVPLLIGLAGIMIAAFGDAAAAIFGRKYGKHKFHTIIQKDELKSYEGLLAGGVVSYLVAFIFVGPIIALFGAATFLIIDYLNPKIADNVLNPILCSFAMMIPF